MNDRRRMTAEEITRDLIRRGLPLPLAGELCGDAGCGNTPGVECPWPDEARPIDHNDFEWSYPIANGELLTNDLTIFDGHRRPHPWWPCRRRPRGVRGPWPEPDCLTEIDLLTMLNMMADEINSECFYYDLGLTL